MKLFLLISAFAIFATAAAQEVWVNGNNTSRPPTNAVQAGLEGPWRVYVGRYFETHEGWIAVRLVDRTTRVDCYYSVDAVEYMCSSFQILTGSVGEYQWVRSLLGDIPHCGVRSNGLFGIGRGEVNGDTVLGKIFPPIFAMFASYHSAEHRFESYDALSRVC